MAHKTYCHDMICLSVANTLLLPLLTLVTVLVAITLPMTQILGQEERWLTYEDSDIGYNIQYPSDWSAEGRNKL